MAADRPARQPAAFDASFVDALADRLSEIVVERVLEVIREEALSGRMGVPPTWIDAHEVARRLGVTREWVYDFGSERTASATGFPWGLSARVGMTFAPRTEGTRSPR
jgi:hypothetical protein